MTDLAGQKPSNWVGEDVFRNEIIIPYFFTTGPVTRPTMLLLFRRPQRVPALRAIAAVAPNVELPFGWRESRSPKGANVDGVLVRAVDASDAVSRLVQAGATLADDPSQWLRDHREVVSHPTKRAALSAHARRSTWLARCSTVVLFGSLLGAGVLLRNEALPLGSLAIPGLTGTLGLLLRRAANRPPPAG